MYTSGTPSPAGHTQHKHIQITLPCPSSNPHLMHTLQQPTLQQCGLQCHNHTTCSSNACLHPTTPQRCRANQEGCFESLMQYIGRCRVCADTPPPPLAPSAFALIPRLHYQCVCLSGRWFCLAAVASPRPGVEHLVGFVAAAIGKVAEFTQEAPFLQQALCQAGSSSSSSSSTQPPAAAAAAAAVTAVSAAAGSVAAVAMDTAGLEASSSSSSGGTGGDGSSDASDASDATAAAAAAAVAVEVVLLGVVSGYRRQGVASRLLQQVKRHARSQG